jgi:hypothetical protein
MTHEIIGLDDWLQSAAGQRVMAWETRQLELAVCDVFGYHAVQLGLPGLAGLAGSRMPHRWVLGNEADLVAALRPMAGPTRPHCRFPTPAWTWWCCHTPWS